MYSDIIDSHNRSYFVLSLCLGLYDAALLLCVIAIVWFLFLSATRRKTFTIAKLSFVVCVLGFNGGYANLFGLYGDQESVLEN